MPNNPKYIEALYPDMDSFADDDELIPRVERIYLAKERLKKLEDYLGPVDFYLMVLHCEGYTQAELIDFLDTHDPKFRADQPKISRRLKEIYLKITSYTEA